MVISMKWIIVVLLIWLVGFEIRIGKWEYKFKGGLAIIFRLIYKKELE